MSIEIQDPPQLEGEMQQLAEYIHRELLRLAEIINTGLDEVRLNELHVSPERTEDGMVILADGTDFNPGSGAGVYVRQGGTWVTLQIVTGKHVTRSNALRPTPC